MARMKLRERPKLVTQRDAKRLKVKQNQGHAREMNINGFYRANLL